MNTPITPVAWDTYAWPIPSQGEIPILYEDEDDDEMGEANLHTLAADILHYGLSAYLREQRPKCQAFANLNLYYRDGPPHPRTGSLPYVSPDVMVVEPFDPMPESVPSYAIGKDGPAPLLAIEVVSPRPGYQRDFVEKSILYRKLGIGEYLLFDIAKKQARGELLIRKLGADGEYHDSRDADGGVTSDLGVRFVIEDDGLRVVNAKTGYRYARPAEADEHAKGRYLAEEQARLERAAREKAEQERDALQERIRLLEKGIRQKDEGSN